MAGGLLQLVAYGAQDQFLTGDPTITFFKSVYRHHTNFAMESIRQDFNGTAKAGNKISATISRNGDLITDCWLEFKVKGNDIRNGESLLSLIKTVELEIGGQRIDRHTGDWLRIWSELSLPAEKKGMYDRYVNQIDEFVTEKLSTTVYGSAADSDLVTALWTTSIQQSLLLDFLESDFSTWKNGGRTFETLTWAQFKTALGGVADPTSLINTYNNSDDPLNVLSTRDVEGISTFYVPLQFFFCKNPGLALPLIALQYHEVKIIIEFNNYTSTDRHKYAGKSAYLEVGTDVDLTMYVNYIYLDVDERRRFAQTSHQMLIDQLQYTEDSILSKSSLRINFNHPVKELIWVYQTDLNKWGYYDYDGKPDPSGTSSGVPDPNPHKEFFTTAQLKLNNQDRFSPRPPEFFRFVQPYQFHTRVPHIPVYVYSFALKPEEHQPSGTCNFSRIDNAYLNFLKTPVGDGDGGNISDLTIKLFAVNYNVLRITSGMGGLAFSN